MKIKSVTDVITNSSTEVFTIKTNKSADEFLNELRKIYPESDYYDIEAEDLNNNKKNNRPTTNPSIKLFISDYYEEILDYLELNFNILERTHW